eukprot:Platyproteum_vivax@DN2778_c0_g1_i1.p1
MDIWLFIGGYIIHFFASCLLIWKIHQQKSVYGLSFDTQIAYLLACISRVVWSVDTRLVETYLAYLEVGLSTMAAIALCYMNWKYRHTTTKQAWTGVRIYVLAPVALILAIFVHPGNGWISLQVLVAFTMYMEALALLPQQQLMRQMSEIEPITSHYVAMLIVSRIMRMMFWVLLYTQGEHFVSLFVADLVHAVMSADYLYLWVRKLRSGGTLVYTI